MQNLLDSNNEMKENAKEAHEMLSNLYEDFNSEIQEATDKIVHITDMTEKYRNIVDLIGKDNLGISDAMLDDLNQVKIKAS
jgi:uncharacterized protein YdaL